MNTTAPGSRWTSRGAVHALLLIASLYSLLPLVWLLTSATKSLGDFSTTSAFELGDFHLWDNLRELFAADPERAQRRLVHVPVGRFAEPEELAAAVAFLASDDASFVTASTFLVDGGITSAYVTPL